MPTSESLTSIDSDVSTVLCGEKESSQLSDCNCSSISLSCQRLAEESLQTIADLEESLLIDHGQDYKLHALLEIKTAQLEQLAKLLESEKDRNERLVVLTRKMSELPVESDDEHIVNDFHLHSSISPLLMQQRYDELSKSNKQCRKNLANKNADLTKVKCDFEELKSRFDFLTEKYIGIQKSLENLCQKYLQYQERKHYEIDVYKTSLSTAIKCIVHAQKFVKNYNNIAEDQNIELIEKFTQNVSALKQTLAFCGLMKSKYF